MKQLIEEKDGKLFYNGYSLVDLAKRFGTPLTITFLDIIKERILSLKDAFEKAKIKTNYKGDFIYLNANKANYGKDEIESAFIFADGLETSSFYDLVLSLKMYEKYPLFKNKLIVCNGLKQDNYLDAVIAAHNSGYKIVTVIDDIYEYEYLKKTKLPLNIGLRIHLSSLYEPEVPDDRFGLMDNEIDYILNDVKNTNLVLNTIHYHQRGFDFEEDKFFKNFDIAFKYYIKAKKLYDSVIYFDFGGGTPLPIDGEFDYESYATSILKHIKDLCDKNNVDIPNLISENGKYSQKDSTVNIYKVVGTKNTGEYPWHIVDSSLLIALPEMYALGEPMLIKPINNLDKKMTKARLAGITCDCDDVYFDKKKGYFEIPDVEDPEDNYIGLLGTGSYQNSMNGKGGVHHCMLPEEKDVIIYFKNGVELVKVRKELQTIEDIYNILNIKH
jgi:arginine decarboxylase